jgi:hypothetical protein
MRAPPGEATLSSWVAPVRVREEAGTRRWYLLRVREARLAEMGPLMR